MGPQLDPIKVLHRHNGYVSFSVKDDEDNLRPKRAIRADALDRKFPALAGHLTRDSFVSLNGAYRHIRGTKEAEGYPQHRIVTLRFLCACYCDIDFYNVGSSLNETTAGIRYLVRQGKLPRPSILVDSGHGMWCLWLLHDENDPAMAHLGAFTDNPNNHYRLYAKINRAIGQLLATLGADRGAIDGARLIRVPGSWRNDQERTVRWKILRYGGSIPPSYTLKELARFFEIKEKMRLPKETAAGQLGGKNSNRNKGWKAAARNSLLAFETLMGLRGGGFDDSCRNHAAYVYAILLKRMPVSRQVLLRLVDEMGSRCRPPLSSWQRGGAIKSALKQRVIKIEYQTIADWLDIHPEEAEIISQKMSKPFPAATRFGYIATIACEPVQETRASKQTVRRNAIRSIIEKSKVGKLPSLRAMQAQFYGRGIEVSHVTIRADYRALRITTEETMCVSCDSRAPSRRISPVHSATPARECIARAC